jgi:hypothetical protein
MRTLVAVLAVVAMLLLTDRPFRSGEAMGRASQPIRNVDFTTPGTPVRCVFVGEFAVIKLMPVLYCWRLRPSTSPRAWPTLGDVVLTLEAAGRPRVSASMRLGVGVVRHLGVLRVGETWWGNERGLSGTQRSRGRIIFRCSTGAKGLTCRSVASGHGFFLGRTRGIRVF